MQIQSLGREDLMENEMATHSSIFAWEIPRTAGPDRLQSIGLQRVGYDSATKKLQPPRGGFNCKRQVISTCRRNAQKTGNFAELKGTKRRSGYSNARGEEGCQR